MQKQKITTIIIVGGLLILIGVYFYKNQIQITEDVGKNEEVKTTTDGAVDNSVQNDDSVQEVSLSYDKDGNLTIVPAEVPQKDLPPMPNLDRKITFSSDFPADQKTKTTQNIKEIISRLKDNSNSVEDWIDLGSNRQLIGDYDGAVEAWKYASAVSPFNIVPLSNLGNLYHYQLKNYPKAEEYFLLAVEKGPSYISTYLNLYDLYSLSYKQDTNSAENILLKGLKNNPNEIELLITLADYYSEKEDKTNALNYYKQALEQAKNLNNPALTTQLQQKISSLE
ncbi:hypothetical protein L6261_00855 [Candidatus Parcubacteria bacterium]|nr:hypothetical protein [Candidatus Parcubacteria bacterium]